MDIEKALRKAYSLGQRYWQQADSEYVSQNKKASATEAEFDALISSAMADLSAPVPAMPMQDDSCDETDGFADFFNRRMDYLADKHPTKIVRQLSQLLRSERQAKAMPMPNQEISISRQSIIDVLLSTAGLSEGITADAIIEAIGAKQEPSGVVPECIGYSLDWLEAALKCDHFRWDGDQYEAAKFELEASKKWLKNNKSPRITEQDAREIVTEFEYFAGEGESAYEDSSWEIFMDWKGRTLLNKLNGNAVAEVRQEPVGEVVEIDDSEWPEETIKLKCTMFCYAPRPAVGTKLYTHPQPSPAAAIPDGWQLVPAEHTEEMESAFRKGCGLEGEFYHGYLYMLSAAPKPVLVNE